MDCQEFIIIRFPGSVKSNFFFNTFTKLFCLISDEVVLENWTGC